MGEAEGSVAPGRLEFWSVVAGMVATLVMGEVGLDGIGFWFGRRMPGVLWGNGYCWMEGAGRRGGLGNRGGGPGPGKARSPQGVLKGAKWGLAWVVMGWGIVPGVRG
ncbi:hypothetical protein CgunFtcFv8_027602 [Champsocephalus gunnari]|uniref:Uncharacterized protein n=1 Tax=Champsocephalus gunnari TaxID=52237 RepID=A0AAN8E2R0_CHAGU|nr:hypothetical protein CgunFtcFv8_027602 [Champsocephalus gunnari]